MEIGHGQHGFRTPGHSAPLFFGKKGLARLVLSKGHMKKTSSRKGSILMEYLIAVVFVGAVLMIASTRLFYSHVPGDQADQRLGDDPRVSPPGFGAFGKKFAGFYQRTAGGLALPVP